MPNVEQGRALSIVEGNLFRDRLAASMCAEEAVLVSFNCAAEEAAYEAYVFAYAEA